MTQTEKTYWIADTENGRFEGPISTVSDASARLAFWIADGIAKETEVQSESGFSDAEIEARVRGFYSVEIQVV